jgi:hypothetical protein
VKALNRPRLTLPGPAVLLVLICLALLLPTPIHAEGGGEASHAPSFKHDIAFFVGVTEDRSEEAFTLGFEYDYRIVNWVGLGGLIDVAFGDERTRLIAAAAYFRPTRKLILILAPGVERFESTAHHKGRTEFVLRTGVAWEFEITERFYLAPALKLDFVDRSISASSWVSRGSAPPSG